jgi:hypothetical protein
MRDGGRAACAEDATPGADSHEAETGGWVSVTPLGTVTAGDGNAVKVSVSFTSNLLPISAVRPLPCTCVVCVCTGCGLHSAAR